MVKMPKMRKMPKHGGTKINTGHYDGATKRGRTK
jgi:hypothetical protein